MKGDFSMEESYFVYLFKRFIQEDTWRKKILDRFQTNDSIEFEQALVNFTDEELGKALHVGSGSYADVFRLSKFILKIIRLLPESIIDRIQTSTINRTTKYSDAFNEFQISSTLSKLNQRFEWKKVIYTCPMFPLVRRGYLTNDAPPGFFKLSQESNSGRELPKESVLDIFDGYLFHVPRENMVIVMEDCGQPLTDVADQLHPYALVSAIKQMVIGFVIAEATHEFEHRDLHSGNVLLQPYPLKMVNYLFRGKRMSIASYGYAVKIIDTTFSRVRTATKVYYKDLSHLFENFNENEDGDKGKKMRMQDISYKAMAEVIDGDWGNFYPKTNLIWMKYIIYKLLKAEPIVNPKAQLVKEAEHAQTVVKALDSLMGKCLNSYTCFTAIANDRQIRECVRILHS